MTRIANLFENLRRAGKKGLIAYVTAGDPAPERTPGLVEALERGGADLIELGVPFSDPIADGPVIQRAGERALRAGTTLHKVLDIAREIRSRSEIPLLLFTYLNPVLRYGLESLAKDASASGIDGCLLTDASVDEAGEYAVFDRLRLSGFAHGCDRRARIAFGRYRTSGSRHALNNTIAAGGRIRDFAAGACGRTGPTSGSSGGWQRHHAPHRAKSR